MFVIHLGIHYYYISITFSSHIVKIQSEMAERALELLALPEDKVGYLLDLG